MKRISIAVGLVLASALVFAQQQAQPQAQPQQKELGEPNPEQVGVESAQQKLKEVSVDKFENDGYWLSSMSTDEGYTTTRLFDGSPAAKQPIEEEKSLGLPDKSVLGTRIDYLRRGYNSFMIYPVKPIPIEGITKTISVWAVGRNYNNVLKIVLQDFFGNRFELFMGKLNFQGWKKLTVAIPPQSGDGTSGIIQRNYHYNNHMGLKVIGFKVECDPMEAYGSYYIYLDDLRAFTDLFAEENRDPDDMVDTW